MCLLYAEAKAPHWTTTRPLLGRTTPSSLIVKKDLVIIHIPNRKMGSFTSPTQVRSTSSCPIAIHLYLCGGTSLVVQRWNQSTSFSNWGDNNATTRFWVACCFLCFIFLLLWPRLFSVSVIRLFPYLTFVVRIVLLRTNPSLLRNGMLPCSFNYALFIMPLCCHFPFTLWLAVTRFLQPLSIARRPRIASEINMSKKCFVCIRIASIDSFLSSW